MIDKVNVLTQKVLQNKNQKTKFSVVCFHWGFYKTGMYTLYVYGMDRKWMGHT